MHAAQVFGTIPAHMSAAAVNIIDRHKALIDRARVNVQRERYRMWRKRAEGMKTATGAREVLVHVPEDVWRAGFSAEAAAEAAVVDQLVALDD